MTRTDPLSLTPDRLVADFRANVAGALAAARATVPAMRHAGRGSLLLTGGGFALEPEPALASLGVGKAGLRNLAFSLFAALKPHRIHVATVTVCGLIGEGRFAPDAVAEAFWSLHGEPEPEHWRREIVYR